MAILETEFDNEKELENWVKANIEDFLPGAICIPVCRILTISDTTLERRLVQQIELYIEGVDPQFVIFKNDTNQDLQDNATAQNDYLLAA